MGNAKILKAIDFRSFLWEPFIYCLTKHSLSLLWGLSGYRPSYLVFYDQQETGFIIVMFIQIQRRNVTVVCAQFKPLLFFHILYDILTFTFNSHYIYVNLILKHAFIIVSHYWVLQVISKQGAIMVSHTHL